MNLRFAASALCLSVALVSGGASNAEAFGFGLLRGCGPACCDVEPSCGCEPSCAVEPSCCVAEASCCDPCAPRRCGLLSGLKGLFHRNSCCEPVCAEPSCCAPEPSCCVAEPTCCAPEPTCCVEEASCCDPCCAPRRCRLLDGLKGLFHRNHCCEPACGCAAEPSCGCEPSCAAAPSCGC